MLPHDESTLPPIDAFTEVAKMSTLAKDLILLTSLPTPHGSLTNHLLREIAMSLIAQGMNG